MTAATAPPPATPSPAPSGNPAALLGVGIAVLLAILLVGLLVRARRRRRAALEGEEGAPEAWEQEALGSGEPAPTLETGGPTETPLLEAEAEAEAPAPELSKPIEEAAPEEARRALEAARALERKKKEEEKARRRAEFEARQKAAQREKDAAAALRAEAKEAERRAREEEARRRAEEAEARRRAMLAPSGPLTAGLSRTRRGLVGRLEGLFSGRTVDEDLLEEVEEVLFTADIGVKTASKILEVVREKARRNELGDPEKFRAALKAEMRRILESAGATGQEAGLDPDRAPQRPYVLMVVGVNGVGKTTTIGKLAGRFIAEGRRVVLAAADTFRAAAVEQLEVWGERVGAPVVKKEEGADPGSVAYDAVAQAKRDGADVVIVDTAGRLHTKVPLMEELKKVHRVLGKAREGAPDDVLLVVDATTGQNAIQQAKMFMEAVPLTAIALTKLDGTAKGGVVLGIIDEVGVPVRFIGTGEKVGDLRPFDPEAFVEALFSEDEAAGTEAAAEAAPA
ncbi:MAG: signal recognition particle-docking protein FtsY [Deltaproteobacteria bacterium]|nr:MAG: signal recognition particle-docking protein FtsY [Deltaproteobacteria bacterium]